MFSDLSVPPSWSAEMACSLSPNCSIHDLQLCSVMSTAFAVPELSLISLVFSHSLQILIPVWQVLSFVGVCVSSSDCFKAWNRFSAQGGGALAESGVDLELGVRVCRIGFRLARCAGSGILG